MKLVDLDEVIDAIESKDWYHINNRGELSEGAEDEDHALYKAEDVYKALDRVPVVDAVPIEFIRSEIKNSKGFYNSSLRRLLDAWAERKTE